MRARFKGESISPPRSKIMLAGGGRSMEKVLCDHGKPCILKTGLKKGNRKTYGQSFYICSQADSCKFLKKANVPVMTCPVHSAPVGRRSLKGKEIFFHCSKKQDPSWCGWMPVPAIQKKRGDLDCSTESTERCSENEGECDKLEASRCSENAQNKYTVPSPVPIPNLDCSPPVDPPSPVSGPNLDPSPVSNPGPHSPLPYTSSANAKPLGDPAVSQAHSQPSGRELAEATVENSPTVFSLVLGASTKDESYSTAASEANDTTACSVQVSLYETICSSTRKDSDVSNYSSHNPDVVVVASSSSDSESSDSLCDDSVYGAPSDQPSPVLLPGPHSSQVVSPIHPPSPMSIPGPNSSLPVDLPSPVSGPNSVDLSSPVSGPASRSSVPIPNLDCSPPVDPPSPVSGPNLDPSPVSNPGPHSPLPYTSSANAKPLGDPAVSQAHSQPSGRELAEATVENSPTVFSLVLGASTKDESYSTAASEANDTTACSVQVSLYETTCTTTRKDSDVSNYSSHNPDVVVVASSSSDSESSDSLCDDSVYGTPSDQPSPVLLPGPHSSQVVSPIHPPSPMSIPGPNSSLPVDLPSPVSGPNSVDLSSPVSGPASRSSQVVLPPSPVSIPDLDSSQVVSPVSVPSLDPSPVSNPDPHSPLPYTSSANAKPPLGEPAVSQEHSQPSGRERSPLQPLPPNSSVAAAASEGDGRDIKEPQFKVGHQYRKLVQQYRSNEELLNKFGRNLPDGGAQLKRQMEQIAERMARLKKPVPPAAASQSVVPQQQQQAHYKVLLQHSKMLTLGAVKHLHSSIASCPTDETLEEEPEGLEVSLMHHQKRALAWLQWRETQTPSGGILADDMGLGKTLSILSLVLKTKQAASQAKSADHEEGLVRSKGTLVVVPASLMLQWEGEVRNRLEPGALSVKIYHGPNRTRNAAELAYFDVVVTTYNIVNIEGGSCQSFDEDKGKKKKRAAASTTLYQVYWNRIVLDEAHVIRNPKSGTCIGACNLKADHRWALTGTPIQNCLKDFYSLIKFIRLAPFDDAHIWKSSVESRGSVGMSRLNTMVSSLVLRRTKEEVSTLTLTKKSVQTHALQLSQEESEVYQFIFKEAQQVFTQYLAEQGESSSSAAYGDDSEDGAYGSSKAEGREGMDAHADLSSMDPAVRRMVEMVTSPWRQAGAGSGQRVLALLLRLRQCCNHPSLLASAIKDTETDKNELDLAVAMGALALEENPVNTPLKKVGLPRIFNEEYVSSKVSCIMKELEVIKISGEKSVVVSQWTTMLDIIQQRLYKSGISYTRIDGKVPPAKRSEVVDSFNSPCRHPAVLLLSLQAGGVGLNLTGGNHVFMVDLHWNPALEEQAVDRCHRMGQKKDVFIHRLLCTGTLEERIRNLQERKLKLSRDVLSGASKRASSNKLTLSDLKHLFEIDL